MAIVCALIAVPLACGQPLHPLEHERDMYVSLYRRRATS